LSDRTEVGSAEPRCRSEEVRVVECVDYFSPQLQRESFGQPLVLLERDVPVFLERRAGGRVRARRVAEGVWRGFCPRGFIEPIVQAVFGAARSLRVLPCDEVRALEAAEQARIVIVLDDHHREAALVRANGRKLPATEEPVSRSALVQILFASAEG